MAFIAENWEALVGVLATAVGGLWAAFVYFDKRRRANASGPGEQQAGAGGSAPAPAPQPSVPTAAVVLALAGLGLIGYAISERAGFVSAVNSVVGKNIDARDISIDARTSGRDHQ